MRNLSKCFKIVLSILLLSSCGISGTKGSGTGTNNGGNVVSGAVPITIDNAGVVPIIGQSSTRSVIYVHNNTNQTISGISYSSIINTNTASTSSTLQKLLISAEQMFNISSSTDNFVDPSSVSLCSTIPAHQSCPLGFNTPIISNQTAQGSALITLSYQYLDKSYQFNQVINYARVPNNTAMGSVFNSGAIVYGFGNNIGYATVYMYGSGSGKIYNIESMTTDKSAAIITQGNITGNQIQSSYIQAVEVSAPTGSDSLSGGYNVTLSVVSSEPATSQSFTSNADLGVMLTSKGAILNSGLIPNINASVSNPTGSTYIVNSGNSEATLGNTIYPGGVISLSGPNNCSSKLVAGGGCILYFKVPNSSGTGNAVLQYTGGKYNPLIQTMTWYNALGGPLLQMSLSVNPILFNASIGGQALVTVTNVGDIDVTNINVPSPVVLTGNATATTNSLSCTAGGTNLPVGQSCTYIVNISDALVDHGAIKLNIGGTYMTVNGSQSYVNSVVMSYISVIYVPVLNITPQISSMSLVGNNVESVTKTLVVSNDGGLPATITSSALFNNPSYMVIESDACNNAVLSAGSSCNVVIKMGPVSSSTFESGVVTYTVSYTGGSISTAESTSAIINYTLQSNEQNLSLQSVSATNNTSGNGRQATPYIFVGNNVSSKFITLTYINSGSDPIKISGISNSNSPIAWSISSSTCANATLSPGATCTVVFSNVLNQNIVALSLGIGSSYQIDLTLPTFVFQDTIVTSDQFIIQPPLPVSQFPASGTIVYVNNHQATVANSMIESAGVLMVQNTLTNGTGYSSITITSKFESYYTGIPVNSSGCSESSSSGTVTQNCVLTPNGSGNDIESATYTINPFYIGQYINALFSISPSGQTVSMTPLAQQVPVN